jgi:hypothetical protein
MYLLIRINRFYLSPRVWQHKWPNREWCRNKCQHNRSNLTSDVSSLTSSPLLFRLAWWRLQLQELSGTWMSGAVGIFPNYACLSPKNLWERSIFSSKCIPSGLMQYNLTPRYMFQLFSSIVWRSFHRMAHYDTTHECTAIWQWSIKYNTAQKCLILKSKHRSGDRKFHLTATIFIIAVILQYNQPTSWNSLPSDAESCTAGYISCLLWNTTVHYRKIPATSLSSARWIQSIYSCDT